MHLKLKDLNLSPKPLGHITKDLAKKEILPTIKARPMMNYYFLLKIKIISNKKE